VHQDRRCPFGVHFLWPPRAQFLRQVGSTEKDEIPRKSTGKILPALGRAKEQMGIQGRILSQKHGDEAIFGSLNVLTIEIIGSRNRLESQQNLTKSEESVRKSSDPYENSMRHFDWLGFCLPIGGRFLHSAEVPQRDSLHQKQGDHLG
jgi:hypothetical protein